MNNISNLTSKFADHLNLKVEELSQLEPKGVYDPIIYTLGFGGKRIRPVMVLLLSEIFSGESDSVMDVAFAVEMFHNFTLLHDDLMDRSEKRRGKDVVYRKYGENPAILSGDLMSILSYKYLNCLEPSMLKKVLEIFTQTSIEVCCGQQYDMEFEDRLDVTVEQYIEMIRLKTAVLLAASLKIGAVVGGASDEDAQNIYNFGIDLGLAFQLKDDLLDVYGDEALFGKQIGGDIFCNKKTYMLITALEDSSDEDREELVEWIGRSEFDRDQKISAVVKLYDKYSIKDKAIDQIERYYRSAIKNLENLSGDKDRFKELFVFAETIKNREF